MKITAVTVSVVAVRDPARASVGSNGRTATTASAAKGGHTAATSWVALVTFRRPRVNDAPMVETVNDQTSSVTQDDIAVVSDGRTSEPLIG